MATRGTIVTGRRAPKGMRGKPLQIRGDKALVANLYASQERIGRFLRRANERTARQTRDLAEQLAPKDDGDLANALTYEMSPDRLSFTVFHDEDKIPAAKRGAPYWIFQELGFRHWLSGEFIQNAHLFPAWESMRPVYASDVSKGVKAAIAATRPAR